jgi:N4-gp56 family major capsid protein
MLKRALPYLVIEKFGQSYPIPNNSTKTAKFRRYEALPKATVPLIEGVTPAGKTLTFTDVTATLMQYGDFVPLTDVIADTHEDAVFMEAQDVISEQAAQTVEAVRYGILKAGTNVYYSGSGVTARTSVVTPPVKGELQKVVRGLKRQNTGFISKMTSSSPNYGTVPIRPSFVGLTHVDTEADYRAISGFTDAKDYAVQGSMLSEYEFGTAEGIRLIQSTVFECPPPVSRLMCIRPSSLARMPTVWCPSRARTPSPLSSSTPAILPTLTLSVSVAMLAGN